MMEYDIRITYVKKEIKEIKQKHINPVLKLNCYRDISISDETGIYPLPEHLAAEMKKQYLYVMTGESMILSEPDARIIKTPLSLKSARNHNLD